MADSEHISYSLVGFMILTFILLLVVMIYSSMAAADIKKDTKCGDDAKKAHKYSTISGVISGVAAFCVLIMVGMYIYSSRKLIAKHSAEAMEAAQKATAAYSVAPPTNFGFGVQ